MTTLLYDMLRPKMIQTLALLLVISYIGVAARRWRPAMLFDAMMLALVFWRPYPALLAFAVWLIGVRWVRAWATWVALSLKLDTFGGHTLVLSRFLLPAWNDGTVNHSQIVMSRSEVEESRQTRPDQTQTTVSADEKWVERMRLDRTRAAAIELMVYSGWTVGQVRTVVKGDNGTIGSEVEAAKVRLGIAPDPPRDLTVRDTNGERAIPFATRSGYVETDPDLAYQPPPRADLGLEK